MAEAWLLIRIICSSTHCAVGALGPAYSGEHARAECLTQASINDTSFRISGTLGGWGCAPDMPSAAPVSR